MGTDGDKKPEPDMLSIPESWHRCSVATTTIVSAPGVAWALRTCWSSLRGVSADVCPDEELRLVVELALRVALLADAKPPIPPQRTGGGASLGLLFRWYGHRVAFELLLTRFRHDA